jgi:hypothetical protein
MGMARIGILGVCALAPALFGCVQNAPPSPLGPAPVACQQEARRLGFTLLGAEGAPDQLPGGTLDYPILVQWGNDGGVHLRCRLGPGGGVQIG